MKTFIVYCHPSEDSFTRCVRDAFINGLKDAGHEYVISDLYKMDFKTDMTVFTRCSGRKRLPNWSDGLTGYGPMDSLMAKRR